MNKKKTASAIVAAALGAALIVVDFLTGCGTANNSSTPSGASSTAPASISSSAIAAAWVSAVDVSFDSSDAYFNWKGDSYTTLNMSTGSQTITRSGVYEITGTLADGSLIVDVDKAADKGQVTLVLNNTSITSATSAPIYVKDAKKVVVILENGTTNTLNQGINVTVNSDNEPSAALFSKADLTITGSGTLNVTSDYNDGITSKDTLKITDGTLNVKAAGDGITGKDILAVQKGSITVTAGKDGMQSTNDTDAGMGSILLLDGSYNISSINDAIQAYSTLQIDGGTYTLTTGGGYSGVIKTNDNFGGGNFGGGSMGGQMPQQGSDATSSATQVDGMAYSTTTTASGTASGSTSDSTTDDTTDSSKCLKADGGIIINGGDITLSSYEDAVHSKGSVTMTGGTVNLRAGDQGIQADGDAIISGGNITIQNSYEGIESKNITVTGGDIKLTASDDGFNVNDGSGLLTIGGGTIYVNAGGDGLDSNGSITMTGGAVTVDGPTDNGNGALDYNTSFDISGGSLVATGSSGMAEIPGESSSQASILMYYSATQAVGTVVTLKDSTGTTVATFTPSKEFNSAAISAPGLKTGQSYTLYSGDTAVVTFTPSDTVTYLNESGITTNQGMAGGGFSGGQGGGFLGGGPGGQFPGGQFNGTKPGANNGG